MPNYQYECQSCRRQYVYFQGMSEDPLRSCPDCGGPLVRLLSGGGGVIYKGSGFYVNDYKKDKGASAACAGSCSGCPAAEKAS